MMDQKNENNKFSNIHKSIDSTRLSTLNKFHVMYNKFLIFVHKLTGHNLNCIKSYNDLVEYMYRPVDAASIGIGRLLFGLIMLIDIPEERGGSELDFRWGDPLNCSFPLFSFISPLSLPRMGIVYAIMWMGALGIMTGYKFRITSVMYVLAYWYIFLLDKSVWNNHSYLYGLCGILFMCSSAHNFASIDAWRDSSFTATVPFWNYFILKFQFFILYFVAGLKKFSAEWLSGYAMNNLSYHWVFTPFRFILGPTLTDLIVIHWFGCIFDLTIAFWLIYDKSRPISTIICAGFHLMNSRLFAIGMFPWVCLAELPLFYKCDWPRTLVAKLLFWRGCQCNKIFLIEDEVGDVKILNQISELDDIKELINKSANEISTVIRTRSKTVGNYSKTDWIKPKLPKKSIRSDRTEIKLRHHLVISLLIAYCLLQLLLPYSHSITKGYNNWTDGLYGYSWDMMVHEWDRILIVIKVIDNSNGEVHFLEPFAFTDSDRWTKHADMAYQYAKCIERNLLNEFYSNSNGIIKSKNISIYFDVWCSLNGRFQQRFFDPDVDILTAKWSPFEDTKWILPLLHEFTDMRIKINEISNHVFTWSNYTDVMFIADFPNLIMDNYISSDLDNVTMTVIDGAVRYEDDNGDSVNGITIGQNINITPGIFHRIITTSRKPSCFMYTYVNKTMVSRKNSKNKTQIDQANGTDRPLLPLKKEFLNRIDNYKLFLENIANSLLFEIYKVPMPHRLRSRLRKK